MIAVAHRWSEVHDQHRFAIYSLVEAHGCHCEGTGDGLLRAKNPSGKFY